VYEKDGAQFFKTTAFGDDQDRVVVKSDGEYAYIAPDRLSKRSKKGSWTRASVIERKSTVINLL